MIRFYKPSPSGKGHACSFYTSRDGHFFACLIKQDGWDAVKRTGSFSANVKNPDGNIFVKFSAVELASILDAIDNGRPFVGFHESGKSYTLMVKFEPYEYKDKKGLSFMVTKTNKEDTSVKTNFTIGFSYAEARLLREHITFMLHESFKNSASQDYNIPTDSAGSQASNTVSQVEPKQDQTPKTGEQNVSLTVEDLV